MSKKHLYSKVGRRPSPPRLSQEFSIAFANEQVFSLCASRMRQAEKSFLRKLARYVPQAENLPGADGIELSVNLPEAQACLSCGGCKGCFALQPRRCV